jgi:hypothetical protein
MRGDREYEFVGVGAFVAEGDARFLAQTLTSYGYQPEQVARRRMAGCFPGNRYSFRSGPSALWFGVSGEIARGNAVVEEVGEDRVQL